MLKWTASAQRLNQLTPNIKTATATSLATPQGLTEVKMRRRRRATITDKENLPYTSTPMVARERRSPLVLSPLTNLFNGTQKSVTPSPLRTPHTPDTCIQKDGQVGGVSVSRRALPNRRHSTVGHFILQSASTYASTLPRCFEEEYSPSAALPTGQQVALRGLLPDPFLSNLRYFNTPELAKRTRSGRVENLKPAYKSLPRKLEDDFAEIARECSGAQSARQSQQRIRNESHSAAMSDQTLDKLIDAILDSARKDAKKKGKVKTRKSFNLRRRTLIKNQAEQNVSALVLSPSYAAGDDPASDLSFRLIEPVIQSALPKTSPLTPAPATPLPGTPLSDETLRKMPTPPTVRTPTTTTATTATPTHFLRSAAINAMKEERLDTTFQLETPVRLPMQRKRQRRKTLALPIGVGINKAKRFKVDGGGGGSGSKYFEVGVALPSIYV